MSQTNALATQVARWVATFRSADLPADVAATTKLRVMDILGLSLAGASSPVGRATRAGAVALSPVGPARIVGTGDRVGVTFAALANGTFSQALEYDDTHNESIVHMSSPAVATALAVAETQTVSGVDLIAAIAIGNEVACRVGSVAPGQSHKRGYHPTGIFAAFGSACLASRLLGLDAETTAHAIGIVGSMASGILECWVDGTDTKFLHAGWAAQSGITAAMLARGGATGPYQVFEGRFGFFASHLQGLDTPPNYPRIVDELGTRWDSRSASFKPFPSAHVIHPYIDAVLRLREQHAIDPRRIAAIDVPVAQFIVGIVCEPTEEKFRPTTTSHCRVSMQYTLAEALFEGRLGKNAHRPELYTNPEILALARKVRYSVDPAYPGPGRFKGEARITMDDGQTFHHVEEHNRGSVENPMSREELRAKFDENASEFLDTAQRARLAETIDSLETLPDVSVLMTMASGK